MPSPFPGMDPFLEHPDFFPALHGSMHVYIREALQAVLPPPYFAVVNERLWVQSAARYSEPDTDVIRAQQAKADPQSGDTAVATRTRTEPLVFEVAEDERREKYLEIRTRRADSGERVVTTIEILSLSNKMPGEKGRGLYLQKQREVLQSDSHLVEIDLLRAGEHTTPMPLERVRLTAGQFDYHVSVHRFDQPGRFSFPTWKSGEVLVPDAALASLAHEGISFTVKQKSVAGSP